MSMGYTSRFYVPISATIQIDLGGTFIPPGASQVVLALKRKILDSPEMSIGLDKDQSFRFVLRWRGDTAADGAFMLINGGRFKKSLARVAMLTRLDRVADNMVLAGLRKDRFLSGIDEKQWASAETSPGPCAAVFFADDEAVNDIRIHRAMPLVSVAFMDIFGIGPADEPAPIGRD